MFFISSSSVLTTKSVSKLAAWAALTVYPIRGQPCSKRQFFLGTPLLFPLAGIIPSVVN